MRVLLSIVWVLFFCGLLPGGDWPTFTNDTAFRLVSDPTVGASDVQEKDYAWGDVDQDGDIDLVVVRKEPWNTPGRFRNVLLMNEGVLDGQALNGVLVDRTAEYASNATDGGQGLLDLTADRDVALIDVNGDGWLDIVTSTTYGDGLPKTISHPRVYINDGAGPVPGEWQGFTYVEDLTPLLPIVPNFCGVGHGDVTGDGLPDLYFVDYANNLEDRLWVNDGTGRFFDQSVSRMTFEMRESDFGVHAVIADMNGDGARDVVKDRALTAPIRISVSYNSPANAGFFTEFETVYAGQNYHVEVDDLNSDGLLDIVIDDDGIDRYLLNQGNGPDGLANFSENFFPPESDSFGGNIVVDDIDRDGHPDVIVADVDVDCCGCSRHMHLWQNQGNPPAVTFVEQTGGIPISARTGTHDVAVFDLNGDEWLDLVIGTCTGTTVWVAEPPVSVAFSYPEGQPLYIPPGAAFDLPVVVEVVGDGVLLPGAAIHVSVNDGPFESQPLVPVAGGLHDAPLPAIDCGDRVRYYVSAQLQGGGAFTDPPFAPGGTYLVVGATGLQEIFLDEVQPGGGGWSIASEPALTSGAWQPADPNGTFFNTLPAAPGEDASGNGSGLAFVTENGPPGGAPTANDVDGGPTHLISPPFDLTDGDAFISYDSWIFSTLGVIDGLEVAISVGAGNWIPVESITSGDGGEWRRSSFVAGAFIDPGPGVRLRFTVADLPNDSLTEAGIDNLRVEQFLCGTEFRRGDCNDNGVFDIPDPLLLLNFLFVSGDPVPCDDACDTDDDGLLGIGDAIGILNALFAGGDPPAPPYPDCGSDPTGSDPLGCVTSVSCP